MKRIDYIKASFSLVISLVLMMAAGCDSVTPKASAQICINEVVSSNSYSLADEVIGSPDWIELYNPSDDAISMEGYGLSDNMKEPHKWVFPAVSIPPHSYLVVYATKYNGDGSELCTGFGLSKSGEFIFLSDPYYNLIQQLEIPELSTDVSYARTADGSYGYCSAPTPNAANGEDIFTYASEGPAATAGSALSITEVLPKNSSGLRASDGNYYSWAEIRNISEETVSLSDYSLSDDPAEPSKWQFPAVQLGPNEYAVIYLSGKDKDNNGEIHASFRLGSADSALLLSNSAGEIISMFNWETPIYSDLAVVGPGAYSPIPTPKEDNSSVTFTSQTLTEGRGGVYINEILKFNDYSIRDSYGDRSPWAELYNSTEASVSLSGFFLSDDIERPFKWAFPDITIEPGSYIIVFLSGNESTENELHTSFSLSRAENILMLTDTSSMTGQTLELDPYVGDNQSYGIESDGQLRYYTTPTPGAANSTKGYDKPSDGVITDMAGVYISEVSGAKKAKDKNAIDWIELHNASNTAVNLEGWRLTDDPAVPDKFVFPDFNIKNDGYNTITASASATSGVSAPFNISSGGETLLLYDDKGNIRDIFKTGTLRAGVTSGRMSGDPKRVYFTNPTKSAANSGSTYASYAAEPVFSNTSLYQSSAFELTLSSSTPDAKIYYTIDGSKPTTASTPYAGPINISKNTPVKAIAAADGLLQSDTVSSTYLFEKPHTLPVVCLSIDSPSFDEVYSVTDRWKKIEKEGFFEYYDTDGLMCVEFPCGLRINGASTLLMRQKSLSIFLRGGYGQSSTKYQFFPGNEVSEYTSLAVRNSGQDASKARLRDSFFSKCVEGLNLDYIRTKSVIVYINGQYWGLYDLNENQNEDYLYTHYGVDPSTANIIRRNETPLAGDRPDFYRVRKLGLDGDTASDSEFEKFCQWVDADYFTDYLIAQTYFANGDMFNQKYWRTTDYKIKWRPIYYDLDLALGASNPSRNVLPSYFNPAGIPSQDGSLTNMDIYCGLRKNKAWCESFGERYVYVALNYFAPERVIPILDDMERTMEPEMERHIKRWGIPSSVSAWKNNVKSLRDCLNSRQSHAMSALQKEFGFTNAQMEEWKAKAQLPAENTHNAAGAQTNE